MLRATRKVLHALPQTASDHDVSDAALGDWYVNRVVIDRRPLLLLVSSKSLLAILAPARDVKRLPERLAGIVGERLRRLGVSGNVIACEVTATRAVSVGRTVDRSVTGTLVDFAKALPFYLPVQDWDDAALRLAEERLAETPCRASRRFDEVIFPDRAAVRLLESTWPSSSSRH